MNHTYIVRIIHDETSKVIKEFSVDSLSKAQRLESSLWDRIDVENYTVRTFIKRLDSDNIVELAS